MGMWDPDIYAIGDASGNVVYVGRTTQRVKHRLSGHNSAKTPCGEWIRSNPEQVRIWVLEENVPYGKAGDAERKWINKFRSEGHVLFNVWPRHNKFVNALQRPKLFNEDAPA